MHGARGHTPGRIYIEDLLHQFGLKSARNWLDAELELNHCNFCYASIDMLSQPLSEIINLRPILGLRSPVHTLCRVLNPLNAPYRIDGVFHPAYGPMHAATAQALGQQNCVTIKGDGGEAEIKPDSDCTLQWVRNGEYLQDSWPRRFEQRSVKEESLEPNDLVKLWRGQIDHPYGEAAVEETVAVCLQLMGRAASVDEARQQAAALWQGRDKSLF